MNSKHTNSVQNHTITIQSHIITVQRHTITVQRHTITVQPHIITVQTHYQSSEGERVAMVRLLGQLGVAEVAVPPVVPQKQRHPENVRRLRHAQSDRLEFLGGCQTDGSEVELRLLLQRVIFSEGAVGREASGLDVDAQFLGMAVGSDG